MAGELLMNVSQTDSIFLSCGEVSGDVYAGDFIQALRDIAPNFGVNLDGNIWGMMGPHAEAACSRNNGYEHWSYEELQMMGVAEVIPALPRLFRLRRNMVKAILKHKPFAAVLIDSPDYHLFLAAALRRAGYTGKIISLIPPTVWAWRSGRVKNLKRDFDLSLPLFSFEHKYLESHGVKSRWTAHPLAWELRDVHVPASLTARFTGAKPIAMMCGSRRYDIAHHLDTLLGTAEILRGDGYLPVFSIAPGLAAPLAAELRERTQGAGFETWDGTGRELMSACLAVTGVSGTVAVESMMLQKFMVVIYKLNRLTYWVLKKMVRTPYISIPNCLTDAPVFPELLCDNANPTRIADELYKYLDDPALRRSTDDRLKLARTAMGTERSAAFWAECVLHFLSDNARRNKKGAQKLPV